MQRKDGIYPVQKKDENERWTLFWSFFKDEQKRWMKSCTFKKDETTDVGNMKKTKVSHFLKKKLQVKHENSITTTNMIRPNDY